MSSSPSSPGFPWLISLPHELTSEIVAHLAAVSSFDTPSSSYCHSSSSRYSSPFPPNPPSSHWDLYKSHKLSPSSLRDLQNLSVVHTHLLPFCRSQLFRTLRAYPAMHPDRVTALLDLFNRCPELAREVKGVWWSVGVEEYRVPYSSLTAESPGSVSDSDFGLGGPYEFFRWKSEEREVRKAQQRLELLNIIATRGKGLRRLWVAGCETQRKWDTSQSKRSSPKSSVLRMARATEDEDGVLSSSAVARTFQMLLGTSRGLTCVSAVNLAFPAGALRGCGHLKELRLGEDVKVIASNGHGTKFMEAFDDETKASASPGIARPYALYLSKSNLSADTSALFESQWVAFKRHSCSMIEHSNRDIVSTPVLDLSNLTVLSCPYPSPGFSTLARNLAESDFGIDGELKEVALQVTDFGTLVDELYTESSSILTLFNGRSFDLLSLAVTLPSSPNPRATSPSSATITVPNSNGNSLLSSSVAAPPLTISDGVTKLLTFLTSRRIARAISIEFKASIEQGADILLSGLDLEPIARRLSSHSSLSGGSPRSSKYSIDVHFSLSPGCYTSYSYSAPTSLETTVEEDLGAVERLRKERVQRSYRGAVDMLSGAGVELDVGYDVVI